jgi:hypothetical protein
MRKLGTTILISAYLATTIGAMAGRDFDSPSMKATYGEGGWVDYLVTGGKEPPSKVSHREPTPEEKANMLMKKVLGQIKKSDPGRDKGDRKNNDDFDGMKDISQDTTIRPVRGAGANLSIEKFKDRALKYWPYIYEGSVTYNIPPRLILAIAVLESGLDPSIVRKTGQGTASYGLMQVNSSQIPKLGYGNITAEEALEPEKNICMGARLLSKCMMTYGFTPIGINCYNRGVGGGDSRTEYVNKVMNLYNQAQALRLPGRVEFNNLCRNTGRGRVGPAENWRRNQKPKDPFSSSF